MPSFNSDYKLINTLPCFNKTGLDNSPLEISTLTTGLSHTCYVVCYQGKHFFVKKLNDSTAATESICVQAITTKCCNLSPKFIYQDKRWLVTDYVLGESLVGCQLSYDSKLRIGIKIIVELHQLSPLSLCEGVPFLETHSTGMQLLANIPSQIENSLITKIIESLSERLNTTQMQYSEELVLCHGDVNHSNILIDNKLKAWLVDYECAHLAAKEYDLAMYIAVNGLSSNNIDFVVNHYNNLTTKKPINRLLLIEYVAYCYLINGLWYLTHYNCSQQHKYLNLAKEQWFLFDNHSKAFSVPGWSLLPLLDALS